MTLTLLKFRNLGLFFFFFNKRNSLLSKTEILSKVLLSCQIHVIRLALLISNILQAESKKDGSCRDKLVSFFIVSFTIVKLFIFADIVVQSFVCLLMLLTAPTWGFPGGTSGKDPVCQCRSHKRHKLNP